MLKLSTFSIGDVCSYKLTNDLNLVVKHVLGKAGVGAERVEVKIFKFECWILNWMSETTGKVKKAES